MPVVGQIETPNDSVLGVFTDPDEAKACMWGVRNNDEGDVFSLLFPTGTYGPPVTT